MTRPSRFVWLGLAATIACGRIGADDADGSTADAAHGDGAGSGDATSVDAASDGDANDGAATDGTSDGATCPPGGTLCGGTCFDLQTETTHCGSCGSDCQGTKCVNGVCTPILLQSANPRQLALDANHVYWTNPGVYPQYGEIRRVPKTGGQLPTLLASNQDSTYGIAIDANELYWSVSGGIVKLPLGGGSPNTLTSSASPWWLKSDGTHVYWSVVTAPGDVGATAVADGSTSVLAAARTSPILGAVDSTYVYWTEYGGVMRVPVGGGSIQKLASISVSSVVTVDANNIYWVDPGTANNGYDDGALMQMPLGGGTPITLASSLKHWITSIAVDATDVYWTYYGTQSLNYTDGYVKRVPIGGGAPTTLASNQQYCYGVVLDSMHLYWIDNYSGYPGYIMKLPK